MTILRRVLLSLAAALAVLSAVPAGLVASAQDVIADYEDDGQIQGCYSTSDFDDALDELDPQGAIYEQSRDIINLARARCLAEQGTGSGDEGGGGAIVLWVAIGAIVSAGAVGGALWSRSRGGGGR